MKENNKYYIPEISELFIGYEYEFQHMSVGGLMINTGENGQLEPIGSQEMIKLWTKETITVDYWNGRPMEDAIKILKEGQVRVPYLSKEDIEKEGWKDLYNHPQIALQHYQKNNHRLIHNLVNKEIEIILDSEIEKKEDLITIYTNRLYKGNCPSINELRKIQKWLGII